MRTRRLSAGSCGCVALAFVATLAFGAAPSTDGGLRRAADVTQAVREHLERTHAGEWARFDLIEVRWMNDEPSAAALLGPLSGDVDPTLNGSIVLYAEVHEEQSGPERLPLAISVRPWVRVPVASRPLMRGVPISREDYRIEERQLSELHGSRPTDPNASEELQARRQLRPGDLLTNACVEIAPLVITGKRVLILYRARGIELRATGIARRSGRRGETIQVVNLDSRRTVEARVSGPGEVEVGP
jgi:flagella basal body P-ring formation protein FlgA